MNINGLNQHDLKTFKELSLKASDKQLEAMYEALFNERLRRITVKAQSDLVTGE